MPELPVPGALDAAVHSYLLAVTTRGEHHRIGPFAVGLDRASANPFRNYAVPDDGAEPGPGDVAALVALFERHDRTPRLEYVPGRAPAVEPALLAAGFAVERLAPVLACARDGVRDLPPPPGFDLVEAVGDDDLLAVAEVQHEAYGEPVPPGPADVERLRRTVRSGGVVVLAREAATGDGAGAGLCTAPAAGVRELAAVAVRGRFRRRGIAGAVTARLAMLAQARGAATVWLEPAGEAEQRIYERAGFAVVGSKIAIAR
ncbi:MAG: GNAT family N-acetyltransferase [Frankiaceae bacterium]